MYEGYKGLNVYQLSYSQVIEVYKVSKNFPREELFVMTTQMRRAATSIPLNIAEGYGKKSSQTEYRRFLTIAKGSCNEIRVLIDLCYDLGYIEKEKHESLSKSYEDVSKMLTGLMK